MAGIKDQVEATVLKMRLFGDTIDEWAELQKTWMYLGSIFSAQDIQRQLPQQSQEFTKVDKAYKEVRAPDRVSDTSTVVSICKVTTSMYTGDFYLLDMNNYLYLFRGDVPKKWVLHVLVGVLGVPESAG